MPTHWRACRFCGGRSNSTDYCKPCALAGRYGPYDRLDSGDEPATVEPLKYAYDAVCLMCGRHFPEQGSFMLDRATALRIQQAGVRCGWCSGVMLLEAELSGGPGATQTQTVHKGLSGAWRPGGVRS